MAIKLISPAGTDNGTPFPLQYPTSLGLYAGTAVTALVVNGTKYGSGLGGTAGSITLDKDDYWNSITIKYPPGDSHHAWINNLIVRSKKGQIIGGGSAASNVIDLSDIRILRVGGVYQPSNWLTSISVEYIEGYAESTPIIEADAILDFRQGPLEIDQSTTEHQQLIDVYSKTTTIVNTYKINASASGEYFAKFSVDTGLQSTSTDLTQIQTTASSNISTTYMKKENYAAGEIAVLMCNIQIMRDSDNNNWFYPSDPGNYWTKFSNTADAAKKLVGAYDFTAGLDRLLGLNHGAENGFSVLTT
jgi:hypothetical protein